MSILNDFSDQELIDIVNQELKSNNLKTRVASIKKRHGHDFILAYSDRNAYLVIQPCCIYPRGTIAIRAVHRITNRSLNFTFLFNGQGGKNLTTLLFNGEEGSLYQAAAFSEL